MKEYIHPYEHNLAREIERVKESQILESNKELILKFHQHNLAQGISMPRMERQTSVLRKTACQMKKDFKALTKDDYVAFLAWMRQENYKEGSIWTYKNILSVFHKWLNNGTKPDCIAWFKNKKLQNKILPEQLLSQEDIKNLIKAADNKRDKALISMLWETGARVGEIGNARIKDISFDDFGARVFLNGKTGMRKVRIVHSAPYLLDWFNEHPYSKNIDAPLWICTNQKQCDKIGYNSIVKILRTAKARAGIQKPINPHQFRHSRATYTAQFLTDAQMKEYFGWGQDSKMAARYVHLSGKQVDDAILTMCGLKKKEEQKDILQREPCPRCKHLNEVNSSHCQQCWLPLTIEATREMKETEEKDQEGLISLMKLLELAGNNPEKVRQALIILQQNNTGRY
ncbi:MAG: tyrosine-type recombinase/integrase [archaeon]